MKCLSLWEPWATLMAIGAKRIETRSWETSYRGWLAIHAAKHFTTEEDVLSWNTPFRQALQNAEIPIAPYRSGRRFQFPFGCIVAVVKLVDCVHTELLTPEKLSPTEAAFGNYDPYRFGWITDEPFRLPRPIPYKGKQGLFDVESGVLIELREQWKAMHA